MSVDLISFQQSLQYTFQRPELLRKALTHSSVMRQNEAVDAANNERLEFLGDRVLGLCVAELLFTTYPKEREGALSKRHASLVRQETLAYIGRLWKIGDALRLGKWEDSSGGRDKDSILSCAVEAVLAGIYLDGGFEAVRRIVYRDWTPLLAHARMQDAKTSLQEWLQAQGEALPIYVLADRTGKAHAATFTAEVQTSKGSAQGSGDSKKQAEQAAAAALLDMLGVEF